jgi:hypothetical protein
MCVTSNSWMHSWYRFSLNFCSAHKYETCQQKSHVGMVMVRLCRTARCKAHVIKRRTALSRVTARAIMLRGCLQENLSGHLDRVEGCGVALLQ